MRQFNIKNEMNTINYHKKVFDSFSKQAGSVLNKLKEEFNKPEINISTTDISDKTFEFTFWGINLIVKTEILFDTEKDGFVFGELNSYVKNKEDEILILTYKFDTIGNIENRFLLNDFSLFYYSDLILKIIEYSKNNQVKFKL